MLPHIPDFNAEAAPLRFYAAIALIAVLGAALLLAGAGAGDPLYTWAGELALTIGVGE